jgi:predicted 3-demethylubiquinone-9 3-methyltransferase (glyoxalase superfamily)
MQKITTFLTFPERAEEAAKFYVSIFKPSKIVKVTRYGASGPGPKGSVMTVQFKLAGQDYIALNGGSMFEFTMGVSLTVDCKTQKEIDTYTRKLTASGGKQLPCGWVQDKFGMYWQITPSILPKMIADKNAARADRAMHAMMHMMKLDIAALKKAYVGEPTRPKRRS